MKDAVVKYFFTTVVDGKILRTDKWATWQFLYDLELCLEEKKFAFYTNYKYLWFTATSNLLVAELDPTGMLRYRAEINSGIVINGGIVAP